MKITETWLRSNATSTSYSRGENYINEVKKLTKRGNKYTAQVYGTDTYYVTIEIRSFDASSSCSCPYDWGGICKHVVAMGLNIIAGKAKEVGEEKEKSLNIKTNSAVSSVQANAFYDTVFMRSKAAVRTQFLKQLFEKDSTLRAQFQQFSSSPSKEIVLEDVSKVAAKLRKELNDLDFDIEYISSRSRQGNGGSGYYDDYYENLTDAAIELVEECMQTYSNKTQTYLEKGNLSDATRVMLGMYEATFGLETPYFEDYEFFEDLGEQALEIVKIYLERCEELSDKIVKNETNVQQVINLIFERSNYFHKKNVKNDNGINYDLTVFESYFKGLVHTKDSGKYLLTLLEKHEYYSFANTDLYLYLAKIVQDEDLELKILENFANNSTKLSKQLLNYYFDKNQFTDFYRIARQSFTIFPNQLDDFLLEKITPEYNLAFYLEVLHYFTKKRNNVEGYQQLKKYWTAKEKEEFLESNRLNTVFYVEMLEVEQRFEEILQVVKTNKDTWIFDRLTRPILPIYPKQMLDIYFERAHQSMGPGAQDRKKYKQVAKELKSILQITQFKEKRTTLIKQLKNKYRNLPAFQDEMRKAGF